MAIETSKENICINHIINQKKEAFIVKGDIIIPDIKPDILKEINTSGILCIYKKEVLDGKIRIDGNINTYTMYLADDENSNIRSINSNLDFSQIITMDRALSDMDFKLDMKLKNIECKILNERKISLTAFVEAEIKIISNENVDIIENVNIENIQKLEDNLKISTNVGSGSVRTFAKDTLIIDTIDNLAEIMKTEANIINKDIKLSYNKILAKADLSVKILYLTEDNRINSIEGKIPIMGFIDMPDISEENSCETNYEIKNIVIKPNQVEEHSIYIEAEIEISCNVYKTKEIKIIQDMYSPKKKVSFTRKQLQVIESKENVRNICNIRENQKVPEINGNKIYDASINIGIEKQTLLNDKVMYEGNINIIYIFNKDNSLESYKSTIPFSYSQDFLGICANSNIETKIEVENQEFVVSGDDSIDVKIDISFTTFLIKSANINVIDDIKEEDEINLVTSSLVIYYVKQNDTLWKIAKKFASTVSEIKRVNGIEDPDVLNIGKQLFIPRYNG